MRQYQLPLGCPCKLIYAFSQCFTCNSVFFPLSGTNWVGQILSDLVATFEKKRLDEEKSVNDEELEEFPYLEIGDTEKYEVGTEFNY